MSTGQVGHDALQIHLFVRDLEGVPAVALLSDDGDHLLVVDDSIQTGAEGVRDAAFRVFNAQIDRIITARRIALAS